MSRNFGLSSKTLMMTLTMKRILEEFVACKNIYKVSPENPTEPFYLPFY